MDQLSNNETYKDEKTSKEEYKLNICKKQFFNISPVYQFTWEAARNTCTAGDAGKVNVNYRVIVEECKNKFR
jgi:hypothetical protein